MSNYFHQFLISPEYKNSEKRIVTAIHDATLKDPASAFSANELHYLSGLSWPVVYTCLRVLVLRKVLNKEKDRGSYFKYSLSDSFREVCGIK